MMQRELVNRLFAHLVHAAQDHPSRLSDAFSSESMTEAFQERVRTEKRDAERRRSREELASMRQQLTEAKETFSRLFKQMSPQQKQLFETRMHQLENRIKEKEKKMSGKGLTGPSP